MSVTNYSLMLHSIPEDTKPLMACRAITEICMLLCMSFMHTVHIKCFTSIADISVRCEILTVVLLKM